MTQWALRLLFVLGVCALADQVDRLDDLDQEEAQVKWVRSKGGFFSPKLAVRPIVQDDPNSAIGVFTTENVPKGETLMVIPKSALLTAADGINDLCDTVVRVMDEHRKKEESEFWPYINHVLAPRHRGLLPSSWSDQGKHLLETILGSGLPRELPVADSMTSMSYEEECGGSGDPYEEEVFHAVLRRSWNGIMVPLFDLCPHRNRPWHNVDSNSIHEGDNVTVYATRDIVTGERLYLSDNDCVDCDDENTNFVQQVLKDYGFVEQYPQRWLFYGDIEYADLVFELDTGKDPVVETPTASAENQVLKLTWLSQEPGIGQRHVLHGHLRRLRDLREYVSTQAEQLGSSHEKDTTLEFYNALTTALEYAIYDVGTNKEGDIDEQEVCTRSDDLTPSGTMCTTTCRSFLRRKYDELDHRPDKEMHFNHKYVCDIPFFHDEHWDYMKQKYKVVDHVHSFYQVVEHTHSDELNDTCLYLNSGLQACSSLRPHYHEVLVHYPVKFLKHDPKRVISIGGGDNMVLHEVLKYEKSLEFVVSLELDQTVVRKSFQHFGNQPHWDNDKVQWWYGDATKSLQLLPREYYGTFDLVLVDIETMILENLKLNDGSDLTFIDAVLMLMKPDGIIMANQDFGFDRANSNRWTDYSVDLYYDDIPITCQQGLTMGSNSIDFLNLKNAPRTSPDDVDILYMPPIEEMEYRFDGWYNYRRNMNPMKRHCREPGSEEDKDDVTRQESSTAGVVMILEAENALVLMDSSVSLQAVISDALNKAGLTVRSVQEQSSKESVEAEGNATMVFLLQEGYVVVRAWPEHKYCAFDVMLWSSYNKLHAAKTELVAAVGSKVGGKSSSSYRIVTGGMFGVDNWKQDRKNVGPHVTDICEPTVGHPARNAAVEQKSIHAVIRASSALIQRTADDIVVVLCGEQKSHACRSLEALTSEDAALSDRVVPVWTCPKVTNLTGADDASQRMYACEIDTLHRLTEVVGTGGKIVGILIDPDVPRAMGQVLLKGLTNTGVRMKLLAEDYVVLETVLDTSESSSWSRVLLDRFQTDFASYDPAYRAQVLFNDTSSSVELGVFSTGDNSFYSHLVDVVAKIEKESGLLADVQYVQNGFNNYVADMEHSRVFTNDDFDHESALEQWFSQEPLGRQKVVQFDVMGETRSFPPMSGTKIKDALQAALLSMNYDGLDIAEYCDVGDGCVVVALWSTGNAVLVWDGRTHIDMNIFSQGRQKELYDVGKTFLRHFPYLEPTAHDEQPRGFGMVVNFKEELGPRDVVPRWAQVEQAKQE